MSHSKRLWKVGGVLLACCALFLVIALRAPSAEGQAPGGLTLCNLNQPPNLGSIAQAITTTQGGTTQFISDQSKLSEAAWCAFVALNWAAQGSSPTMTANPSVPFGQQGASPVVWESWLDSMNVYCQQGGTPGNCTGSTAVAAGTHQARVANPNFDQRTHAEITGVEDDPSESVQATGFSLPDKNNSSSNPSMILYEVRMNPSVVTFIQTPNRSLYNLDQQVAFYKSANPSGTGLPPGQTPIDFPPTAFEVKASWYAPTQAEINGNPLGLFLRPGQCYPGTCPSFATNGQFGLSGLHILWKVFPKSNWMWMTFQYDGNATLTPLLTSQQTVYSCSTPPCTTSAQSGPYPPSPPLPGSVNQAAAALNALIKPLLKNTPFAKYSLVGVQVFPTIGGTNTMLANSHIETDLGATSNLTSSCVSCHYNASVGAVNCKNPSSPRVNRLPVCVDSSDYPCTQGFMGSFQPTLYAGSGGPYVSSDFIWSMRRATWQNTSSSGCTTSQ